MATRFDGILCRQRLAAAVSRLPMKKSRLVCRLVWRAVRRRRCGVVGLHEWGSRGLRRWYIGLLGGIAVCAAAGVAPQGWSPARTRAFRAAMGKGNAKTAMRIARQAGMGAPFIGLYRDQLEYRLPELAAAATACRNAAYVRRDSTLAANADMVCESFVRRTTFNLGNARAYFEALAWLRSSGASLLRQMRPRSTPVSVYPSVDLAKLANSIPPYSAGVASSGPILLPYADAPQSHTGERVGDMAQPGTGTDPWKRFSPTVVMTINGRRVEAAVDSGQPQAIVMSVTQAKMLGLRRLTRGPEPFRTLGMPPLPASRQSLSLVSQLQLGPLEERNVMAVVIPPNYGADEQITIGLPLLARFKRVTFSEVGMTLNAPYVACPHRIPVAYAASQKWGNFLVFDAQVSGKAAKTTIDTGANALLVAGRHLMLRPSIEPAAPRSVFSATFYERVRHRYLAVSVGPLHISSDDGALIPSLAFPDVLIGAPVLAGADIHFTFRPKLSICLIRRTPKTKQ